MPSRKILSARTANSYEPARLPRPTLIDHGDRDGVSRSVVGVIENMTTAVCACCGQRTTFCGVGGGQRLAEQANMPLIA